METTQETVNSKRLIGSITLWFCSKLLGSYSVFVCADDYANSMHCSLYQISCSLKLPTWSNTFKSVLRGPRVQTVRTTSEYLDRGSIYFGEGGGAKYFSTSLKLLNRGSNTLNYLDRGTVSCTGVLFFRDRSSGVRRGVSAVPRKSQLFRFACCIYVRFLHSLNGGL